MAGVIGDKAYDLRRVVVTINGVLLSGAADGDFVVIAPNAPDYNSTPGARGEIAVSRNNDESGTVQFRFYQGASSQRAIVEQIIRVQRASGLQQGTFARIEVKDLQTGEHLVMDQCWSADKPGRNFGAEQQAREYTFGYAELEVLPL